jgi:hypothetical protein
MSALTVALASMLSLMPLHARHRTRQHEAVVAHPDHRDAERVGRTRALTGRSQAQPERRVPHEVRGADDQQDGDDGVEPQIGGQAAHDAGDVGKDEPALALEIAEQVGPVGQHRQRHGRELPVDGRPVAHRPTERTRLLGGEPLVGQEPRDTRAARAGDDVDREPGDDVVDAERRGGEGEEESGQ